METGREVRERDANYDDASEEDKWSEDEERETFAQVQSSNSEKSNAC